MVEFIKNCCLLIIKLNRFQCNYSKYHYSHFSYCIKPFIQRFHFLCLLIYNFQKCLQTFHISLFFLSFCYLFAKVIREKCPFFKKPTADKNFSSPLLQSFLNIFRLKNTFLKLHSPSAFGVYVAYNIGVYPFCPNEKPIHKCLAYM